MDILKKRLPKRLLPKQRFVW